MGDVGSATLSSNSRSRSKKRSARTKLTGRAKNVESDWDAFLDKLKIEHLQSVSKLRDKNRPVALSPYERPSALLKRGVYRFVRDLRARRLEKYLEDVIAVSKDGPLPSVPFKQNPFYWALSVLRDDDHNLITRNELTRFGRQLIYADRHDIMPDLLVGFIHQCGAPDVVSAKAANPAVREPWWREPQTTDPVVDPGIA